MKEFSVTNSEKFKRIDPVILFCVFGMNLISIITLASASDSFSSNWYVTVQTLASVVGFALMLLISFIDYDALITKGKFVFFALSILLILWVFF